MDSLDFLPHMKCAFPSLPSSPVLPEIIPTKLNSSTSSPLPPPKAYLLHQVTVSTYTLDCKMSLFIYFLWWNILITVLYAIVLEGREEGHTNNIWNNFILVDINKCGGCHHLFHTKSCREKYTRMEYFLLKSLSKFLAFSTDFRPSSQSFSRWHKSHSAPGVCHRNSEHHQSRSSSCLR